MKRENKQTDMLTHANSLKVKPLYVYSIHVSSEQAFLETKGFEKPT